jgi:hypothetical protein
MSDQPMREMSLKEVVDAIPGPHRAKRELAELEAQLAQAKELIEWAAGQSEENHNIDLLGVDDILAKRKDTP